MSVHFVSLHGGMPDESEIPLYRLPSEVQFQRRARRRDPFSLPPVWRSANRHRSGGAGGTGDSSAPAVGTGRAPAAVGTAESAGGAPGRSRSNAPPPAAVQTAGTDRCTGTARCTGTCRTGTGTAVSEIRIRSAAAAVSEIRIRSAATDSSAAGSGRGGTRNAGTGHSDGQVRLRPEP